MNDQETAWWGKFGDEYLQRNQVEWQTRMAFWQSIAALTNATSAVEIGCSAGWNLHCLRGAGLTKLFGIDVNASAARQAVDSGLFVANGSAPPILDRLVGCFDLTFTVGVLIHVSPKELSRMMWSIMRASSRWVLAVEYAAEEEEAIEYRGKDDLLWKRNYGDLYEELGLFPVHTQFLTKADGFDDCTAWLFEKRRRA